MEQQQSEKPPSQAFSLRVDERGKETMKWSAIWNAVAVAVITLVRFWSLGLAVPAEFGGINLPVGALLTQVFWGLVWGAVGGFLLSHYYELFKAWNVRYLGGRLDTFFKLLFYPTLAGSLLVFVASGLLSAFAGLAALVMVAGIVGARFFYAAMMARSVGKFYL